MSAFNLKSRCCHFKPHHLSVLLLIFFYGTIYPILGYSIKSLHVNSTSGQRKLVSGNRVLDFKENNISPRSESRSFLVGSKFFEAGNDVLSCSTIGANRVSNVTECKQAASTFDVDFSGSETDENYPSGCYFYKKKEVFWNNHNKGDKDRDSSPICKLDSSQLATCLEYDRRCDLHKECCSRKCNHYTTRRCS